MKRVLVKSVHGAFGYVMEHYYPFGMAAEAAEQGALTDTYAVISIQDTVHGGFGFELKENAYCKGVLTLYFDDVIRKVDGAVCFDDDMARKVISFIKDSRDAETLLVHCYGGESRSRAVAAFAVEMLGGDNEKYFSTGNPNMLVYNTLKRIWEDEK